jgi:4-hydroxybenzoate polyprenyltransferase
MVYSFPKKGFKYKPVLGTLTHFVGQILHFEMGYSIIKETGSFSLLISIYFALLFSAGHINHELIDYEADKTAGTQTGAVYFGKKTWAYVSFFLFTGSTVFLLYISIIKVVNIIVVFPFIAAGFIHVARKLMTYRYDFSRDRFLTERSFYRFAYFVAGILFVVIKGLMTI